MQRRVGAKVAGLVAGLGLALAACAPSNTPESYDDALVEQNFLEGCTNMQVNDTLEVTDDTIQDEEEVASSSSAGACRCMFDVYVENVPYNDAARDDEQHQGYNGPTFTQLDDDLGGDDPQPAIDSLPADVRGALVDCRS